jgi:oligopeptide/dipeptide ABC transporter ATP-binding protein
VTTRAALLEVSELTTQYESSRLGTVVSLDRFSTSLQKGEILGIVGESGAGKTVLLRTILGVFNPNERVAGGEVLFREQPLPILDDEAMRPRRGSSISLIQSGQRARLDPVRRIGDQLVDVMNAHDRVPKEERLQRAEQLLRSVGMADPRHQLRAYPHELSGGMCQRIVIALALANSPELLMADEPTAGLDVTIQIQILDLIRKLVRETGAASILATRDLSQVAHYCDRVVVLRAGQIVEEAKVADFFAGPASDYGRYLMSAAMAARGEELGNGSGPAAADTAPRVVVGRRSVSAAGAQPLLEVHDLVKHYRTQRHVVHAVNGISFAINPGETLALVGESGSGKTTVGRCIAGLVHPTSGRIRMLGQELGHISTRKRARQAALETHVVFQEPRESLNPRWTLGQSVEEPLRYHGKLDRRGRASRVLELFEQVGLVPELADHYPHQTTAGVQQRVAVARAIAVNPRLVVLDEPTSALDMSVKAQMIDLLIRLQEELGLSYLFISHDMTAVKMIAHQIAIMYLGTVVEHGPAAEVFEQQVNPYGRALLSSVLYPDPAQERGRFTLAGEIPSAIELPPGCPLSSRCPLVQPRCTETRPPLAPVGGMRHSLSACLRTDEILAAGGVDELHLAQRREPSPAEAASAGEAPLG